MIYSKCFETRYLLMRPEGGPPVSSLPLRSITDHRELTMSASLCKTLHLSNYHLFIIFIQIIESNLQSFNDYWIRQSGENGAFVLETNTLQTLSSHVRLWPFGLHNEQSDSLTWTLFTLIGFSCLHVCSVYMNPSKQHFLQKKALYEEGRIQTPELLSSDDLCTYRHF